MASNEIVIEDIDDLKTQTFLRKIVDKGEVIDTRLITKISLEAEVDPADIAQIHRLLQAGHKVNMSLSSPQLVMEMFERKE